MRFVPILFSTAMVKSILDGSKTQTRRTRGLKGLESHEFVTFTVFQGKPHAVFVKDSIQTLVKVPCDIGDIFWVRETWLRLDKDHIIETPFVYKANGDLDTEEIRMDYVRSGRPYKWKPSIFMPKEACRIFLKVTNVRVERLKDISEEDAIAEGIVMNNKPYDGWYWMENVYSTDCPINGFLKLWESINGKESLESNPWVWVYDFEMIEKPDNFL